MSTQQRVALVTGASQGIGTAIVTQLYEQHPELHLYVGCRRLSDGQAVIDKLGAGAASRCTPVIVELTDIRTMAAAADLVRKQHGGLDILVNNAGWAYTAGPCIGDKAVARKTVDINYKGPKLLTEHLLPLMRQHGSIVNLGSTSAAEGFKAMDEQLRAKYMSADLTVDQLDALIEDYMQHADTKLVYEDAQYCMSKCALSMWTRIMAEQLKKDSKHSSVRINVCCPGWCSTGMTVNEATAGNELQPDRTAAQGAKCAVYLASLPADDQRSGMFWFDQRPVSWTRINCGPNAETD